MADFEIKMNPDADRVIAALILDKANEAVAAVGPAAGRLAADIESQLSDELAKRGVNLPRTTIGEAAAVIAAGRPFEFRG